jgi:hypothetical protein
MGGITSGNHGGRPTIEDSLVLDINRLIRRGFFMPGRARGGSLIWSEVRSGRQTATIGYEVHMTEERGWARLFFTTASWSGETTRHDYRVELVSTPQPFGGRRWWWVCPKRGDLVSKLYKSSGGIFASRKAHRLGYRSQRESPRDRALGRALKLRQRLSSTDGIGDFIPKPKGMRWRTYDRHMHRVKQTEATVTAHTRKLLQSLTRRLSR